jgi:hypothetical protein
MKSWSVGYALVLSLGLSACGLVLDTSPPESRPGCSSSAECSDGDVCNGVERCVDRECKAGEAPSCDDGLACTHDSCAAGAGCVNEPSDDACEGDQVCLLGEGCTTATPCASNDDCAGLGMGTCAVGVCGPAGRCTVVLHHELCDDAVVCTTDVCSSEGVCQSTSANTACSDGLSCTRDVCDPGSSDHDANGCVFMPDDQLCDDGFGCTVDYCIPDNEYAVAVEGCVHVPHDEVCSGDGADAGPQQPRRTCAEDVCVPTLGCRRQARIEGCEPGLVCNLEFGLCEGSPHNCDTGCDDGDPCNGVEACIQGFCQPTEPACPYPDNECTRSFCASTGPAAYTCLEWPRLECYVDTLPLPPPSL